MVGIGLTLALLAPDLPPPLRAGTHSQMAFLSLRPVLPSLQAMRTLTETFYLLMIGSGGNVYRTPSKNNIFTFQQQNAQYPFLSFLSLWQQLNTFLLRTI